MSKPIPPLRAFAVVTIDGNHVLLTLTTDDGPEFLNLTLPLGLALETADALRIAARAALAKRSGSSARNLTETAAAGAPLEKPGGKIL